MTCPRCGARALAGQEYCLDCGIRLPGPGAVGSRASSPRAWVVRAALAFAIALGGAAAAVAATDAGDDSSQVVTATGGFATLPTTSTLESPSSPAGIVEWPVGEEGWTIALASIPQTEGRRVAEARARDARRKRLSAVGILDSSRYASLHPGYWIVFTGVYGSEAEATSALQPARRASRTATVRRVVP
jgi:hypothetical protein